MKPYIALIALTALAGCSHDTPAPNVPNLAGKCDEVASFDLAFERFDEAAQEIAHGSGCFIRTDTAKTGSIKPSPVKGSMTRREAVAASIRDSGLQIVNHQPDQVTVE